MNPMNFPVERASKYVYRPPSYSPPFEIGCFSIDAESRYRNDGHQMKYLSMPEKPDNLFMDLNEGFHEYIHPFEDTDKEYSAILKWIVSHQDLIKQHFQDKSSTRPKIDFVLFRGRLTDISSTIYENMEDWMIYATKYKSIIYLCNIKTDRKLKEQELATEKEILMTTWGFKFEQYMVSDTVSSKPDTSAPVNENEKYYAVFKGKLGHHRLLFAAEMDGVDPTYLSESGCNSASRLRYIELKTCKIISNGGQGWTFRRFKLLKWYLQSYFAGVPQVICGFRNDEGIVRKLKTYNVKDMPEMAGKLWSPTPCFNFLSHFLDHVKQRVVKDEAVYKFYWKPGSKFITCEELDPESAFLPEWFTSKMKLI